MTPLVWRRPVAPGATIPAPPAAVLRQAAAGMAEGIRKSGATPLSWEGASIRVSSIAHNPDAPRDRAIARQKLAAANDAYFALDLKSARDGLKEAANAVLRTPQTPEDLRLLSDLKLLEGMIALADGDRKTAGSDFDLVVRLTPDRTLDTHRYPPHVVAALAQAFSRHGTTADVAQVDIHTQPTDALVAIDGVARGRTDLSIDRLETGEHYYRIERPGRLPLYGAFELTPGENAPIVKQLDEAKPADLAPAIRSALAAEATDVTGRGATAKALAGLYATDRVLVAAIEPSGPRQFSVEMWWGDADGVASTPIVRRISAEPSLLAAYLVELTQAVLASPASRDPTGAAPPTGPMAADLALLASGDRELDKALVAPPKAWYDRLSTKIAAGGLVVGALGALVIRENAQAGKVNIDVTNPRGSK